jgi:hypothetical protein
MDYILIPNHFFEHGHKQQLNYNELYLYVFLHMTRTRWNDMVLTSLDILNSNVKLQKNKQKNIAELIKCLISLYKKGLISFHIKSHVFNEKVIKEHKHDLKISLNHDKGKGWTRLSYSLWEKAENNPDYFMIMAYINQWANKRNEFSYYEFSTVILQPNGKYITEKTAKNKIKEMVERGLIRKESGRYYLDSNNQIKQEINQYTISDEPKVNDGKSKEDDKKQKYIHQNQTPIISSKSMVSERVRKALEGVTDVAKALNWFYHGEGNDKPTYELYELWRESENEAFKKGAGKRFTGNFEKRTDFIEKWEKEYQAKKKEKLRKEISRSVNKIVLNEKKTPIVLEDYSVISITKETIDKVDFTKVKEIGFEGKEYVFDLNGFVNTGATFELDDYMKLYNYKKISVEKLKDYIKEILEAKKDDEQYLTESDIGKIKEFMNPFYDEDDY